MSRISIPYEVAKSSFKPATKLIYGFLFTKAENSATEWVSYPQIDLSHDTGIGLQVVARALKELSKAGLIREETVRVGQPKKIYIVSDTEQ